MVLQRLKRSVRSDRHIGQLAGAVATEALAGQNAALQVEECRDHRQQHRAADTPTEVGLLLPSRGIRPPLSEGRVLQSDATSSVNQRWMPTTS